MINTPWLLQQQQQSATDVHMLLGQEATPHCQYQVINATNME
jgi:hypothetical protein